MPRDKQSKKRGTSAPQQPAASRASSISTKSYIENLPDDILRDVFSMSANESPATSDHNTPFQFLLATVCRHWRNLVMNTPLLWTSIHIPSGSSFDPFNYFERSQHALVDVWFDSVSMWIQADSDLFSQTSNAIANHILRIRSLTIRVWEPKEVYSVFRAWKDLEAPNLRSLAISSVNGSLNPPDTFPFPVFSSPTCTKFPFWQGGKSLGSLKLEGFSYQEFAPLPNLTSLEIDKLNATAEEFQDLLISCPSLEKLIIHQFEASPHTTQSKDPNQEIDASSLRSLAIKIDSGHYEDCLCALPALSMRNLEYIEVVHPWTIFNAHHTAIASQWKKLPKLRKFVIRSPSTWASDISFLSDLPRTTDLEVINFPQEAELALVNTLNLNNLKSITFNLTAVTKKCLDAHVFSDIITREHIAPRCPIAVRLSSTTEIDPRWLTLQTILGDKFSILASAEEGLLENKADYPLILEDEDMSLQWMSGDSDDDFDSDEFREYDEFELYNRDEVEYLREDDVFDDDDDDYPFEYDNYIE